MFSFLSRRRTRLNVLGIVVLVVGLSIGGLLYRNSLQDDVQTDADILLAQEQFKGYDQAVQRNIGATGLLAVHATETLENLAKPRPLAILLMMACGVTAGCFFQAAARQRD